jgi:SAM-dependent MidA family methyltransferase
MVDQNDLKTLIAEKIHQALQRRITFAQYMEWVLYHPQAGYYAKSDAMIGAKGDFLTSPHLGHDFGALVAEQLAELWQILACPKPFTLVEMGAGQGLLAADVLGYLQRHWAQCWAAVEYRIIEKSPALRQAQREVLQSWQAAGVPISWCELDAIATNSVTGCFFSNELVDAFPVHLIEKRHGIIQEVYVTYDDQTSQFQEVLGELSTPKILENLQLSGIDLRSERYPEGYRTEVNIAMLDWWQTLAARLHRGYCLTIDYGYPADRYYSPTRRQGTLQCYYQHRHHNDPYLYIGEQDITAHVNFTALERYGQQHLDLHPLGFTQQALFLMALGLGDRIAALGDPALTSALDLPQRLQRRDGLHQLINPMGLGNFGILMQAKGLTPSEQQQPLKGFTMPLL